MGKMLSEFKTFSEVPDSLRTGSMMTMKFCPYSRAYCPSLFAVYEPSTMLGEILKMKSAIVFSFYPAVKNHIIYENYTFTCKKKERKSYSALIYPLKTTTEFY